MPQSSTNARWLEGLHYRHHHYIHYPYPVNVQISLAEVRECVKVLFSMQWEVVSVLSMTSAGGCAYIHIAAQYINTHSKHHSNVSDSLGQEWGRVFLCVSLTRIELHHITLRGDMILYVTEGWTEVVGGGGWMTDRQKGERGRIEEEAGYKGWQRRRCRENLRASKSWRGWWENWCAQRQWVWKVSSMSEGLESH